MNLAAQKRIQRERIVGTVPGLSGSGLTPFLVSNLFLWSMP